VVLVDKKVEDGKRPTYLLLPFCGRNIVLVPDRL